MLMLCNYVTNPKQTPELYKKEKLFQNESPSLSKALQIEMCNK